jgi:hypothetical protein
MTWKKGAQGIEGHLRARLTERASNEIATGARE